MKNPKALTSMLFLRLSERDHETVMRAADRVCVQDSDGATRSKILRSVLLRWARGVLSKPGPM